LDLIRLNRDFPGLREAMHEASLFLALPRRERSRKAPPAPTNSPEAARRLFRAGRPIPGTQAEAYFRAPGITGYIDWVALRFHPRVWYRESEKGAARSLAGLARRRHRSRWPDHRHPAHLARSHPA
jgi:hypothetical protein